MLFVISNVLILLMSVVSLIDSNLVVRKSTETMEYVLEELTTTTLSPKEETGCSDSRAFKRKKGYWCARAFVAFGRSTFSLGEIPNLCTYLNNMVPSSLETEAEWQYYYETARSFNRTGGWVAAQQNSDGKYYWSDGHAEPVINPQPFGNASDGAVVWYMSSVPNGYLGTTNDLSGSASDVKINMGMCGRPGRQFD